MKLKKILIIEDDQPLRDTLHAGLEGQGFDVRSAANAIEAAERTEEVGSGLDVALIDVELGHGENGIDVAMGIRQSQRNWPPEFLVLSGRDRPEYYQSAFALGAAGYLRKGDYGADRAHTRPLRIEDIADHVRMLALRRALQGSRPGMLNQLRSIAKASRSHEDAMERFCRDVLWTELEAALGGQFFLLLLASGRTTCLSGSGLPLSPSARYEWVEQLVHLRLGDPDPLLIEKTKTKSWLPELSTEEREGAELAFQQLDGIAFVPLGGTKTARLALGVGPDGQSTARARARLVDLYLRQSVVPHLLEITETWAQLDAERRVLVRATSDFCLYQGQEIEGLLGEAEAEAAITGSHSVVERETPAEPGFPTAKLYALAEELRNAGELLVHFDLVDQREAAEGEREIEMAGLVQAVLADDLAHGLKSFRIAVETYGQCAIKGRKDRVACTVFQILSWLVSRVARTHGENQPLIVVQCSAARVEPKQAQILFEEHLSRRLSRSLRDSLFSPFYSRPFIEPTGAPMDAKDKGRRLGLFLARSLAEAEGGTLQDRSDEIPGDRGHRFALELPISEK
jgi:DNA-binding response OmpR family regulator